MNTKTQLTTHWQLAPTDEQQSIAQGVDDIHLCISNILLTQKGSDVLRPDFGSDHFRYIDQPEDIAIPHMVREITQALKKWEKRIVIDGVQIQGTAPRLAFNIRWSLTDAVYRDIYQTQVMYDY